MADKKQTAATSARIPVTPEMLEELQEARKEFGYDTYEELLRGLLDMAALFDEFREGYGTDLVTATQKVIELAIGEEQHPKIFGIKMRLADEERKLMEEGQPKPKK